MTESGGLRVLLIGATGVVGPEALRLALAEPRFGAIVAPTRRPLPPHPKLTNPLVDFGNLRAADLWWSVDGVVATLGTTQGTAGLPEAFRAVDHGYTLAVARLAHAAGATRFALTSSLGADPAALPRPVVRSGCSRRCLDSGGGRGRSSAGGAPLDLGCGWLHSAERNPLVALAGLGS